MNIPFDIQGKTTRQKRLLDFLYLALLVLVLTSCGSVFDLRQTAGSPSEETSLPDSASPTGADAPPKDLSEKDTEKILPIATPPDTTRIALLLPLSGPYAFLGTALSNAAQLALFDFTDKKLELTLYDTQAVPEQAEQAAWRAIHDGATVILGPLFSHSMEAVKTVARTQGITVIGFSNNSRIAEDSIFTMGFFPETEALRISQFAIRRGLRRFAALLPQTEYGDILRSTLRDVITQAGGELIQVVTYNPHSNDLTVPVQRIADYHNRHQALIEHRARLNKINDAESRYQLKLLEKEETFGDVPYDALLLADTGQTLQIIASLLPFYGVDPKKVQVLGIGWLTLKDFWSEPALLGGWFAAPDPRPWKEFAARYELIFSAPPPRLATLSYDAIALVYFFANGNDRLAYTSQNIAQPLGFTGQDGLFRFQPNGQVERLLSILEIHPQTVINIDSAPTEFPPLPPSFSPEITATEETFVSSFR